MIDWLESTYNEIQSLSPGRTMSGSEIADKVRPRVGEPKDPQWWGAALAEAEGSAVKFTGKFSEPVSFLPVNPVYKIPGESPMDFWGRLREGNSEPV